jgi:hypothetical protein
MNLIEFIPLAETLVNELSEQIEYDEINLIEAEKRILDFIYKIGHIILEKVIFKIKEPTTENKILLGEKEAVFRDMQNLRFKNRFGKEILRKRRAYKIKGVKGGYYPLDKKLGLDVCAGFSPLMTYLLSFFGSCDAYKPAAKKLSNAIGFTVSDTGVQKNTEHTGKRIEHDPIRAIPVKKQNEGCELMIVEIDGTMSPQIHEKEGVFGRESMKQPTEYKECNVITIEKRNNDDIIDRWFGAHYGPRIGFNEYVRKTGIKMGQLKAKDIVFIADGAKHNWEVQITNFPDSIPILDFYHATEHLSLFCETFRNQLEGKDMYKIWYKMLYDGETVQVICEMKDALLKKISNRSEAQKHINYFDNNKHRMNYYVYRQRGFPIGSGLVEGACKYVVGKRFKGNGMRWKKEDNEAVLDVRLAVLNNTLDNSFIPKQNYFKRASGF